MNHFGKICATHAGLLVRAGASRFISTCCVDMFTARLMHWLTVLYRDRPDATRPVLGVLRLQRPGDLTLACIPLLSGGYHEA